MPKKNTPFEGRISKQNQQSSQKIVLPNDSVAEKHLQSNSITRDQLVPAATPYHNYILNSNFDIWQRMSDYATVGDPRIGGGRYLADKWRHGGTSGSAGTDTASRQTFSTSQTDVPNNPVYYYHWEASNLTAASSRNLSTLIEDVRTLAGKTATLTFYARANSGRTDWNAVMIQSFGIGGSSDVTVLSEAITLTSSWQKFKITVAIPSITGKILGPIPSSSLSVGISIDSISNSDWNIDLAQFSLVEGDKELPFNLLGRNIAHEITLCQRYYEKSYDIGTPFGIGTAQGAIYNTATGGNNFHYTIQYKVPKRVDTNVLNIFNPTVLNGYGSVRNITQAVDAGIEALAISEIAAFFRTNPHVPNQGDVIYFQWMSDADF